MPFFGLGRDALGNEAEHFADAANLNEARCEREPDAQTDEHHDENIRPKNVVDAPDDISKPFQFLLSPN